MKSGLRLGAEELGVISLRRQKPGNSWPDFGIFTPRSLASRLSHGQEASFPVIVELDVLLHDSIHHCRGNPIQPAENFTQAIRDDFPFAESDGTDRLLGHVGGRDRGVLGPSGLALTSDHAVEELGLRGTGADNQDVDRVALKLGANGFAEAVDGEFAGRVLSPGAYTDSWQHRLGRECSYFWDGILCNGSNRRKSRYAYGAGAHACFGLRGSLGSCLRSDADCFASASGIPARR